MARYTLKRISKHGTKVEVRSQHVEFHVPAFIICCVLAFLIWLYIVGISRIPADLAAGETTPPATEAETVVPAEAEGPVAADCWLSISSADVWASVALRG